jgi:hypothetical protein
MQMGTEFCCRRKPSVETVADIVKLLGRYKDHTCQEGSIRTEVPPVHLGDLSGAAESVAQKLSAFAQEHFADGALNLVTLAVKVQSGRNARIELTYKREPKNGWDTISIEFPNANPSEAAGFVRHLREVFPICELPAVAMEAVPQEVRAQFEQAFQHTQNLTGVAESLVRNIAQQSEKWDESLRKQQGDLDQRFQQRQDKLQAEVDAEKAKLAKAQEELAAKAKAFDDRESRHVRRQLLTQIEQVIEKRKALRLSDDTCRKRWPVHVVCVAGMALFAGLAVAGRLGVTAGTWEWPQLLGMIGGGLAFASTFIYYVRFNQVWLDQHANAEMETMKFEADTLRASWLTELVFEWQQSAGKEGAAFPEQLVTGFSRDLFAARPGAKSAKHPLDDVMRSLGALSRVKVGKGMLELETSAHESKAP